MTGAGRCARPGRLAGWFVRPAHKQAEAPAAGAQEPQDLTMLWTVVAHVLCGGEPLAGQLEAAWGHLAPLDAWPLMPLQHGRLLPVGLRFCILAPPLAPQAVAGGSCVHDPAEPCAASAQQVLSGQGARAAGATVAQAVLSRLAPPTPCRVHMQGLGLLQSRRHRAASPAVGTTAARCVRAAVVPAPTQACSGASCWHPLLSHG